MPVSLVFGDDLFQNLAEGPLECLGKTIRAWVVGRREVLLDLVFCAELLHNLVSEWSTVVRDDLFWNSVPVYDVGTDEVGDCCTGNRL